MKRFPLIMLPLVLWISPVLGQKVVWPTDASLTMTSSFGEYRYNHLHGGIDIKTWGQIGYKALAIDSGSVVRVEVSPYGYGRAVYFRTQDDLIALYAHLSRFAPVLEAKVKAEQRRLGRFAVGLAFPPGQMVFKKGETVAYTGSTGATIPHLHFELRDLQNRLINPLVLGYKVPDRLTPTLVCVSISPLGYGSHVDGDFQPKRVFLIRTGRGKYRLKQTVSCWGDVGIGLSSYDLAEGCPNRLGLYRVKLFVDDVHVFTVENERFFLERIRDIGVGMECRLMRRGLGIFQKLYKEYENALSFYTPDLPGAGMLCSEDEDGAVLKLSAVILKKGMHTLRIEASDYNGNTAEVTGFLNLIPIHEVAATVSFPGNGWSGGIPGKIRVPKVTFEKHIVDATLAARLVFDAPVSEVPRIAVRLNHTLRGFIPLVPKSNREFIGQMPLDASHDGILETEIRFLPEGGWEQIRSDTLWLFRISSEKGGVMTSSDGRCQVFFPPGSVHKPIWGWIRTEKDTRSGSGRLGWIYSVVPDDFPLKNRIQVLIDVSGIRGPRDKIAVFSRRYGAFSFLGKERSGNAVSGWLTDFQSVTAAVDTVPPVLSAVRPYAGERVWKRQPKVLIRFFDGQTGVAGEENYTVVLDSTRLILEYNPFTLTAFTVPDEPLAKGRHVLDIRIVDRVGNAFSTRKTFFVN